jgi:serine/threonine-protein kinase RsbW
MRFEFASTATAPGQARRAIESACGASLSTDSLETAQLIASELVTNAVVHAGGESDRGVGLAIEMQDHVLRVEVSDCGPGFDPPPLQPRGVRTSGWGLQLARNLSSRFGVIRDDPNIVWFELDLAP